LVFVPLLRQSEVGRLRTHHARGRRTRLAPAPDRLTAAGSGGERRVWREAPQGRPAKPGVSPGLRRAPPPSAYMVASYGCKRRGRASLEKKGAGRRHRTRDRQTCQRGAAQTGRPRKAARWSIAGAGAATGCAGAATGCAGANGRPSVNWARHTVSSPAATSAGRSAVARAIAARGAAQTRRGTNRGCSDPDGAARCIPGQSDAGGGRDRMLRP